MKTTVQVALLACALCFGCASEPSEGDELVALDETDELTPKWQYQWGNNCWLQPYSPVITQGTPDKIRAKITFGCQSYPSRGTIELYVGWSPSTTLGASSVSDLNQISYAGLPAGQSYTRYTPSTAKSPGAISGAGYYSTVAQIYYSTNPEFICEAQSVRIYCNGSNQCSGAYGTAGCT